MATSPAPTKFYTYQPGKGPVGQSVKLGQGQTLGYAPGKGYYAKNNAGPTVPRPYDPNAYVPGGSGPAVSTAIQKAGYGPPRGVPDMPPGRTPRMGTAPTAPKAPVDPFAAQTAAQIDARASSIAQGELTPQQQEIQRQQAAAQAQARADEAAITGFTTAAGQLEQGIPGQVSDAYHQATQDVGALGQGISGQVGADLAASQANDNALYGSLGLNAHDTSSVPNVETTIGMLQGVIPGTQLAAQGAAQATLAAEAPQISIDAGRQQLDARMAQAQKDNDGYAQQLIQLAATYPGLKAQALTQLNQYEIDKANYRQQVRMNNATIANNKQSLIDQEKALGLKVGTTNAEFKYKWAQLQFQTQKAATQARLAAQRIAAQGRQVDTRLSEDKGYMVDKQGRPIRDSSGNRIPVKKAVTPGSTKDPSQMTKPEKTKYVAAEKAAAVTFARTLANARKPVLSTSPTAQGKYVTAAKYKAYGYPDGTTDKPGRAQKTGNYADAQQQVYTKMRGDYLISMGYSKEQVMGWVNTILAQAGWSKGS